MPHPLQFLCALYQVLVWNCCNLSDLLPGELQGCAPSQLICKREFAITWVKHEPVTAFHIKYKMWQRTSDGLHWEEKAQGARRGNNQFPSFILALACQCWKFLRVRCKRNAVVVCWKGSTVVEVVFQWHLVYWRVRINLKPLEVYCKCIVLMLWMKNWLGI